MNESAEPHGGELRLRNEIRKSLPAWSKFALAFHGQWPALHHRKVLAALEQVSGGETRRLILLLPPGSAKSTYASKIFPAWWLTQHPRSAVIAACHTARLAEDFGRSVRGLVKEHSQRLGVQLRGDARASSRFLTEQGGEYFAVGVHGAVTGRRADLALIDDPIRSFADAENFAAREHLWNWFRSELVTRLKPNGRVVVVMTRWHSDDLAGRLIALDGWAVLRLPALAELGDPLGRGEGEALWPDWESRDAVLEKKALLGERQFSALFQQMPLRDTGQMFDPRILRIADTIPEGVAVRAWDLAGSIAQGSDPDWTAGVKLVRGPTGSLYVDDVIRFRGGPADVAHRIRAAAVMDGACVPIGLPQDPGKAGKAQVMFLTQILAGFRVVATPETGRKDLRAAPIAAQVANGVVSIRRAAWNNVFLDELAEFPHGAKDDQVDAFSRAFGLLLSNQAPARFMDFAFSSR